MKDGDSDQILVIEIMPDDSEASNGVKVETWPINSVVLAEKSPFFSKLFTNGMRESLHQNFTVRINEYEEAAFKQLVRFMYGERMSVTSANDLMAVLIVADKFDVISCMKCCVKRLLKLPMSLESALMSMNLPSTDFVDRLIDKAHKYLCSRDFNWMQGDLKESPLLMVETLLSMDGLRVDSEDEIYDFVVSWARAQYTNFEERQEIISTRLARFIEFHKMSFSKLNEVVGCPEFAGEQVSKLVFNAILSPKVHVPREGGCRLRRVYSLKSAHKHSCLLERFYNFRVDKVVNQNFQWPPCFVYIDLTRDTCLSLYRSKSLYFQPFLLAGHLFFLKATCSSSSPGRNYFGLDVKMSQVLESCKLDCGEVAVMNKASKMFKGLYNSPNGGCRKQNQFCIPWMELSEYFINGILHVQVELRVRG